MRIRKRPCRAGRGNVRAAWHDYRNRAIYHITLKKLPLAPRFCEIIGDCRQKGDPKNGPRAFNSPVGKCVKEVLRVIPTFEPAARILQYAVMPDHLHFVLDVGRNSAHALGEIIVAYKIEVKNRIRAIQTDDNSSPLVFEEGYNDQIITARRSLDVVIRYVRDNPWRLAVRKQNPEIFRRMNRIKINGIEMEAYGNLSLLRNPFKEPVLYHRRYSYDVWAKWVSFYNYTAANGGVLVSAAIHPNEKAVMNTNADNGAKCIRITNRPFDERFKPAGKEFDLCAEGRLLILHPLSLPRTDSSASISRQCALAMNRIAETIGRLNL